MRVTERQPFSDQIIGQLGGKQEIRAELAGKPSPVECYRSEHRGDDGETIGGRIHRIEERFLVLLHVAIVGERQTLHRREQSQKVAVHPSGFPAHQLGHVWILLLRHDTAARCERLSDRGEMPFLRCPEDELFGEAAQVHHDDRAGAHALQQSVAVGHGVDAVLHNSRKTHFLRYRTPVDGI